MNDSTHLSVVQSVPRSRPLLTSLRMLSASSSSSISSMVSPLPSSISGKSFSTKQSWGHWNMDTELLEPAHVGVDTRMGTW